MLRKLLFVSFLGLTSFFNESFASSVPQDLVDPELIMHVPVQTKNNLGMNFNDLGSFEANFLRDVRALDVAQDDMGMVLLMGEAYGRTSMRALRESDFCNIFSNELSEENIRHLRARCKLLKQGVR